MTRPALPFAGRLAFEPPAGTRRVLGNGLTIHLLKDETLPIIHVAAIIKTGKINDPADGIGLGELTMGVLKDGGTRRYRSDDIDDALEFLGASIEPSIAFEEARVTMFSLRKDLDKVLDIYASVLTEPAFEDDKLLLKKAEAMEMIRRRNDDPSREAQREALRHFYGKTHPYGWRAELASVEKLTRRDLEAWHRNYLKPNNVILAAAGDFGDEELFLEKLNDKFGAWAPGEVRPPSIPPAAPSEERRVYFIDKDVPQTSIVILQKGVRRHDPVEFPLYIANEILGGGLSSRLSAEIRSRMGLAYSVGSYFAKRPDVGFINAYCGTKPGACVKAASEILRQFELMKDSPASEEEVRRARESVINSFVFRFSTPFDLISERALYEHYGYPAAYLDSYVAKIGAVDPEAVLAAGRALFRPERALVFVVGKAAEFDRPLSDLGPATEVKED